MKFTKQMYLDWTDGIVNGYWKTVRPRWRPYKIWVKGMKERFFDEYKKWPVEFESIREEKE